MNSGGPQGVWEIWGEWLFIFRELGSTGNYFTGAREQAHNLGGGGGGGGYGAWQKSKKKNK